MAVLDGGHTDPVIRLEIYGIVIVAFAILSNQFHQVFPHWNR